MGEVTQRRDLHSFKPVWSSAPNITVPAKTAPSRRSYDLIVVGAGISGALVANAFAGGRRRILVCDRRQPSRGSTIASTAMILHEIDMPLHALARLIGKDSASRAWSCSAEAVARLSRLVERLRIDCAFEPRQSLYLAGDAYGRRALAAEAAMRAGAKLPARLLKAGEVRERFAIDATAAIVSSASASANPAQLTAGLLKACAKVGAEIVSPLSITDFEETPSGVVLCTDGGDILLAENVILCTGYEFLKRLESPAHRIVSTWAVASEPRLKRPDWLDSFCVWEGSDPYLYFRSTPDGRVIAGGEDEDDPEAHKDRRKAERKFRRIKEKLRALAGVDLGPIAYGWAAPFGTTTTGLPIIDTVPGTDHVYAVMGFGGNGITFSMIAANVLKTRLSGTEDGTTRLFAYPD